MNEEISMFSLQTWNLWWGGTKVDDGHRKMVDVVSNHGADIICTQELSLIHI